jgi:hypothetical protein
MTRLVRTSLATVTIMGISSVSASANIIVGHSFGPPSGAAGIIGGLSAATCQKLMYQC